MSRNYKYYSKIFCINFLEGKDEDDEEEDEDEDGKTCKKKLLVDIPKYPCECFGMKQFLEKLLHIIILFFNHPYFQRF